MSYSNHSGKSRSSYHLISTSQVGPRAASAPPPPQLVTQRVHTCLYTLAHQQVPCSCSQLGTFPLNKYISYFEHLNTPYSSPLPSPRATVRPKEIRSLYPTFVTVFYKIHLYIDFFRLRHYFWSLQSVRLLPTVCRTSFIRHQN